MNNNRKLKYIKHAEIDSEKWNRCVENAENSRIYSMAWYLDIVAEKWDALIWGDYEFVMPLPVKKKFGIQHIYQPTYCQQLGIFPNPPKEIQKQFAIQLKRKYGIINYQINSENDVLAFESFKNILKVNFELLLKPDYQNLLGSFSKHAKRNVNSARKNSVTVIKGGTPDTFIKIKKEATKVSVNESTYRVLNRLMANFITSGKGVVYAAYSANNSVCAAAFIVFHKNRAYYLNAFSTDEGRENRAMYAIVNEIIKEFSGAEMVLDFEGSVIDGIARFYKGFGAVPKNYFYIYSNRFPVINSVVKRLKLLR
jgi:hypothetical protein